MNALDVYVQTDGEVTKAYYAEMSQRGPLGLIAVALFRAQKRSSAAKRYRGRFRGAAYDVKNWSMEELCKLLTQHASSFGIRWGWKADPWAIGFEDVLYVDLPDVGQVSFHSAGRKQGPDYPGEWDHQKKSAERIIAFCDLVWKGEACGPNAKLVSSDLTTLSGQQSALIDC